MPNSTTSFRLLLAANRPKNFEEVEHLRKALSELSSSGSYSYTAYRHKLLHFRHRLRLVLRHYWTPIQLFLKNTVKQIYLR